jgi:anaerobic selenocysteine-containing dehydrogenase
LVCDDGDAPCPADELVLFDTVTVDTLDGPVACRPVFALVAERCREYAPEVAEGITGVSAADIERAARLLWESRPVALYFWSGIEQHTGTSEIARAICQLYALTGSFDQPGGNTRFPSVPQGDVIGRELLSSELANKALGLGPRPLGPSRFQLVTSGELYAAALEGVPYRVRALVGFGANLLLANADSHRGRDALSALEFFVHADLFMNPTAEQADIVLPVASPFEAEALRIGFEVSAEAQSLVQLRRPVAEAPGEARSDVDIIFSLATRLGLGEHFWNGDVDAAHRHRLEPSGISLEQLRMNPAGVRVPLSTDYERHLRQGFPTPSKKVELYSETLLEQGYPPLPTFEEPLVSPRRAEFGSQFPLVLTCSKGTHYCETQHRQVAALRRRAPDPEIEIHPETASARGIAAGDWVQIQTPHGSVRARAKLEDSLAPDVVCAQHGFWQGCEEIGAPAYDPFSDTGANLNRILRHEPADPMSGTSPLRSYACEVSRVLEPA